MNHQNAIINSIRHQLIVSCQAENDSPFNHPSFIAAFAQSAETGGAAAVRIRDLENVSIVRDTVSIPIIGLTKGIYPDGSVLITPSVEDAISLQNNGADIIAVDGTSRSRNGCPSGAELIKQLKDEGIALILADVDSCRDALSAENAGADIVATTLSGYTPTTLNNRKEPDLELVSALVEVCSIPVIAEGRISTPDQARLALEYGAWSVAVGSAITRPITIVESFSKALHH